MACFTPSNSAAFPQGRFGAPPLATVINAALTTTARETNIAIVRNNVHATQATNHAAPYPAAAKSAAQTVIVEDMELEGAISTKTTLLFMEHASAILVSEAAI